MKKINHSRGFAHTDLSCPECTSPMELVFSNLYRYRDGRRRPFYRCFKYPLCSGTHGAHPNGAPLGKPANKETRGLRMEVHKALGRVFPWKTKKGRVETSRWLSRNGFGQGHVSNMDAEECRSVLKMVRGGVK